MKKNTKTGIGVGVIVLAVQVKNRDYFESSFKLKFQVSK